jgi:hypothetical protein
MAAGAEARMGSKRVLAGIGAAGTEGTTETGTALDE